MKSLKARQAEREERAAMNEHEARRAAQANRVATETNEMENGGENADAGAGNGAGEKPGNKGGTWKANA